MALIRLAIAAIAVVAWTISLAGQEDKRTSLPEQKEGDECSASIVFPYVGQQTAAPQARGTQAELPHWYTLPEWWLCILGIPTLGFLAWQALESRRAAQAARDSIRLQEAHMQQWIDHTNWQRRYHKDGPTGHRLRVQFEIINPTGFPLTIPSGSVDFGLEGTKYSFLLRKDCRLTPENSHLIWVDIYFTEIQNTNYWNGARLLISIKGNFDHIELTGKLMPQPLVGTFWISKKDNWTSFEEETPQREEDANPQ
jgi:hypothetical protein